MTPRVYIDATVTAPKDRLSGLLGDADRAPMGISDRTEPSPPPPNQPPRTQKIGPISRDFVSGSDGTLPGLYNIGRSRSAWRRRPADPKASRGPPADGGVNGRTALYHRAMSPRAKHELAREHLSTAQRELDAGAFVPAIMFLHLAAEAAVVALAESEGIDTRRRHDLKADAAEELFRRGIVSEDLSEVLRSLNQVRKDATYEGEDPDLSAEDLETLAQRIETIVVVAERRVG